jgi:hypothetical protein
MQAVLANSDWAPWLGQTGRPADVQACLVKELIELYGGSINIESKVNVGTVVTIGFPRERVIEATGNIAA